MNNKIKKMNNEKKYPVLLDCTLRDGGYYNNWDFSTDLIENYLEAMAAANIKYVELGFRSIAKNKFIGACGYTKDSFIKSLKIPKSLKIGVMINAKEIIVNNFNTNDILKYYFDSFSNSKISFVRFACHFNEVEKIIPVCNALKRKNLTIILNLMQISEKKPDEIEKISKLLSKSKIDVLYFADSMGSLEPRDIIRIKNILSKYWKKDLGFHAHDNMSRALTNGKTAYENGIKWIDSTVMGMGRGAGNIKTEYILVEISKKHNKSIDISPILNLIEKWFKPLHQLYGWGPNSYYYLAGQYGIHPTFIQSMLNDLKLNPVEILSVIENLKKIGGNIYNKSLLEIDKFIYNSKTQGSWSPYSLIKSRDVLIIGPGPSIKKYAEPIKSFIKKHKPFVIVLNLKKSIDEKFIDLRVASYTLRMMFNSTDIKNFKSLALPIDRFLEIKKKKPGKTKIFNYGLQVKPGIFKFDKKSCISPNSLSISYALSIANSARTKKIYLCGLDGYNSDDPKRLEMDETIKTYNSVKNSVELISITPTKYKIKTISLFAL